MYITTICRTPSEVSRFLNVALVSKGIQQKDFARNLGVDPSWLSHVLNGTQNLTLVSFFKLMQGLDIEFKLNIEVL